MQQRMCDECGTALAIKKFPVFREDLLGGLDVTIFDAVEEATCQHCGEHEITIPNLAGLIAAAAVVRVKTTLKLNGTEIRFLRKALGMTAKQLAEALDVREETISRWENGKEPISSSNEKLLRIVVGDRLANQAPEIPFDQAEIINMKIRTLHLSTKPTSLALYCVRRKLKEEAWAEKRVA